jgi:hypothetical protein
VIQPSILMFANVVVLTFGVSIQMWHQRWPTNHLSGTNKLTNPKMELNNWLTNCWSYSLLSRGSLTIEVAR